MFYWLLKYVLLGPFLRLLMRPRVEGLEHVPSKGAAILAGNHIAVVDSFIMPLMVPRRKVTFLAKAEYFTAPGVKGFLSKVFFSGAGQVPIDRTGGAAHAALNTGKRILGQGKLLGIYPEGTRSPDGRLYRGKTGVARMAIEAGVPVIPVVVIDTDKVNPIGSKMWRPHRVTIRFGAPLDFSRYAGMSGDRFVERSMTDEIMYELMLLSGQEYVDVYAAKVKKLMDKTGKSADEVLHDMKNPTPPAETVDRVTLKAS